MSTSLSRNYELFPNLVPVPKRRTVSLERLPTNTTTYQHPVHRWFNFIAGFSPEFVQDCLHPAESGSVNVLDPFAGCGTTLVAAAQGNSRAIGFEPHEVFARIARAKLPGKDSLSTLDGIETSLMEGFRKPESCSSLPEPVTDFLLKLFPRDVLETLLGGRRALEANGYGCTDLAFLVLSKVLDKSSHSQTDGVYKAPTSRKSAQSPVDACRGVIGMIRTDLECLEGRSLKDLAIVHQASAECMSCVPSASVDLVVTSPPYLNNFDFAEMTRMYLYFWSIANSWREITQIVRDKLIVNTTTALAGHKEKQEKYRSAIHGDLLPELDTIVALLSQARQHRAGKKEYDYLVYPYFAQLSRVLAECQRTMRSGASIHIIVADAALYGVHVSTPQFLRAILDGLGFRQTSCSLIRTRGHRWTLAKRQGSKLGLGEYHVHGIR